MKSKIHEIKLEYEFQDPILNGEKTFEVRYNDRGYQRGDRVKFCVTNRKNVYEPIEKKMYAITYVLSGWGIEPGYVVFGIEEIPTSGADHGGEN